MRIFGWTAGKVGEGSFRYRLTMPFTEAAYQGLCTWEYGHTISTDYARQFDVVLGQGFGMPEAVPMWQRLAADGQQLLVFDNDDDMRNVRPDNPALGSGPDAYERYLREAVPAVESLLAAADLVTVTVPHLAEQYQQFTDAPVVVLPNTLDELLLEIPRRHREPGEQLRVGWSGGASHAVDWRSAADGVVYGLKKANAKFVFMGADFRSLIKYDDVEFHPWKNHIDEYYLVLTTFHVAIAPLSDDLFNRSKSPLKALEAAALGIPVVASDAGPYSDFVIPGETGFLCRTEHDWMKALRDLNNDEDMRFEMGTKAREHATQFTTQKLAPNWIETYQQAYERKFGRRVPLPQPAVAETTEPEPEQITVSEQLDDSHALRVHVWKDPTTAEFAGLYYRMQAPLGAAADLGLAAPSISTAAVDALDPDIDVITSQRIHLASTAQMWEEIAAGSRALLVTDVDDDVMDLPADHVTFASGVVKHRNWKKDFLPQIQRGFDAADLVTVTVPHLAEAVEKYTSTPVVVLPNTVDESLLTVAASVREPGEQLRVGWGGTATHYDDWRESADAVKRGLAEVGAKLLLRGDPNYGRIIGYAETEVGPWLDDIEQYYLSIATHHVALAPLRDTEFNRSKSAIKALEASALGVPVVASDTEPYRNFIVHGETGFLCKTEDDWVQALRTLGNDETLRQQMGQAAREHASQFTSQRWAVEWVRVYVEALARKHGLSASVAS